MANESPATSAEVSATTADSSASTAQSSNLGIRFRCIGRQSNHSLLAQLMQLNQQSHRLEAELLLYLGELDKRQIYREQATASAFEFCVTRLGYSEDVAFKRVGAARLMRRFPLIYDLLVTGRIHLTALMLLKPHLTLENHEEWLLMACEKSKRQVDKLVASRCPRPDVPSSVRQLPATRQSHPDANPDANPEWAVIERGLLDGAGAPKSAPTTQTTTEQTPKAQPVTAQATPVQVDNATALPVDPATPAAARVVPLSSKTYRVTFTANEQLKQKLDRASELLSHCIHPSDMPALLERALDQLLEREEKRRYGARPPSNPQPVAFEGESTGELVGGLAHKSCQDARFGLSEAQDPDLTAAAAPKLARVGQGGSSATSLTSEQQAGTAGQRLAKANAKRSRRVPVAVRRAVFERDNGQCTFVDEQGRRCRQRHFLEFDHIEAHAIGGTETVTNLRVRCAVHNALEAERLFGRERVKSAIEHARQGSVR